MSHFSTDIRELFERWGELELFDSLDNFYQQLIDRRVNIVNFGDPNSISPEQRAKSNCLVLQQALLHRAERLTASTGSMLIECNIYGLAMIARGHFEATAALGYFCARLESLANGAVNFSDFELNIADAVMGSKHRQFERARPPLNILSYIEKADKYVDKHILKAQKGMILDCYNWLSEFAHTNFLSNISALTLDKPNHRFLIRHERALQKEDFQLPGYIDISCSLFVSLYDAFTERLNDGCLDESKNPIR